MARTKSKSQKVAQKAKERALALKAGKAAAASGSAAGGVKRSRFWRSKWLREVKWWQGNKGAERTPVPAAPFERVVREIDQKLHNTTHRFQRDAIKALQTATTEMMTDLLKLGNAITVHKGRVTLTGRTVRFAAEIMKLPTGPKRRRQGSEKTAKTSSTTVKEPKAIEPSAESAGGE